MPEQVLLRRVYFVNPRHSKYISLVLPASWPRPTRGHWFYATRSHRTQPVHVRQSGNAYLQAEWTSVQQRTLQIFQLGFQLLISNHKARVNINRQFIELSLEGVNYLSSNMVRLQN